MKIKLKKKHIIIGAILAAVIIIAIIVCSIILSRPKFELVSTGKSYPHNEESFTQGLFFDDEGRLYETTGMYGESMLYKDIYSETGRTTEKVKFSSKYFVDGSTIFKNEIYILTWREKKVFVYDPEELKLKRELDYPRDGWGLTNDGKNLIASDGTSTLYFMNENMETIRTVEVIDEKGEPVRDVNELEYIEGYIFANIWYSDKIIMIDPSDGTVKKTFDFSNLYPKEERTKKADVLNGIAYNRATRKVYITGKYWPRYYEFELR